MSAVAAAIAVIAAIISWLQKKAARDAVTAAREQVELGREIFERTKERDQHADFEADVRRIQTLNTALRRLVGIASAIVDSSDETVIGIETFLDYLNAQAEYSNRLLDEMPFIMGHPAADALNKVDEAITALDTELHRGNKSDGKVSYTAELVSGLRERLTEVEKARRVYNQAYKQWAFRGSLTKGNSGGGGSNTSSSVDTR